MKTSIVRPCVSLFVLLTLVTGLAYPLLVTGLAAALFPHQANGSLIVEDGRVLGSSLIGQSFTGPEYFWGRPSATAPMPYNAANSAGSNQGPTNPALLDAVKARVAALRTADPSNRAPIPVDLVTASASGLDPEISVAAADYQAPRIARTRGLASEAVRALIARHTIERSFGLLGERRVNVLELNRALDRGARERAVGIKPS